MWLRMLPVVALGASLNISDIVTFSSRDFTTQTTATSAANETAAFLLNGGGGGGAAGGGFGGGMGDGPPDGPGRGGGARRSDDILVFGMNFEIGEVARGVLPASGDARTADRAAATPRPPASPGGLLAALRYAAHYAAAARRAAAGLLRLAGRMCKRRGAADATLAVGVGGPSRPTQATTTAAKAKAAKKKRAGPFIAKAKAAKKKKKKRGGTCPAATTTTAEVNGRDVGVYEEAGVEGAMARIAEFMENLDDRFISLYGGGSGRNLDGALDRMWSHTRILNNVGWLGLADADGNVNSVLIKVTGLHNGDANGKATAEATEAILLDHALTFSGLSPANVNKAGANVFIDKDGSMWFYLCAATVPAGERGKRDLAELARRAGKKPPSKWVLKTDKRSRGVCKRSRGVDAASRGVAKKVSSTWTQAMDDAIVSLVESSGGVDGVSSADWKSLATRLGKVKVDSFGKRRYNTCRLRYVEHLDPTRITGSFSVTEMRVVYEGLIAGDTNAEIAAHLPGRERKQPLSGITCVLTGVFPEVGGGADLNLGKDGVRAMVESCGGRVTGAVSGKTDILIVGKEPGMSKVSKARAANVTLMTLHDLKLGIAHGDVLAAAQPVVIKVFSAGYGGNGGTGVRRGVRAQPASPSSPP
ncbi:hypothetical protein JL721_8523 [Aureococcus anophagefferens]|nr:hypothetical protein JL721_8523 [Aureococcus anophagefferens]